MMIKEILKEEYQRLLRLKEALVNDSKDTKGVDEYLGEFTKIKNWIYDIKTSEIKRVILESPYAGDVDKNTKYARACLRDSLLRGEAPIASHLLYTQDGVLNDEVKEERMQGINSGLAWKEVADLHVFYIDYGMSSGMKYALEYSTENKIPIEKRKIYD